jgi:NifU-like protein
MWDYTDKVMDFFYNPHNMGKILPNECREEETVAVGEVGSIVCGDALRLHLKIDKRTDEILDARFQTFGCASAIASSSALTDLVKGITVDEALQITNRNIADYLEGLPQEKMHCSVMGKEALEAAIANYKGIPIRPEEEDDSPLVCTCFAVSRGKILRLIQENHLTSAEQVTNYIKAGGGCGSCLMEIDDLLAQVNGDKGTETQRKTELTASATVPSLHPLTNLQKISLIQQVIEEEVRPSLALDGGDVELYEVDGNRVQVVLKGACDSCPSVTTTLRLTIEDKLRDRLQPDRIASDLVVEAISDPN